MDDTKNKVEWGEIAHSLDGIHPRFFRNYEDSSAYARFGCECRSGWRDIILSLAHEILNYCELEKIDIPRILQIKQKSNRLVIHLETEDVGILSIADMHTEKSTSICETCAEPLVSSEFGKTYSTEHLHHTCKHHMIQN